jgi:HAD superfamily phosphatase
MTVSSTDSSTDHPAVWLRPGLRLPARLDTALFDVDGVLIDTCRSYRLAVMHASEHLVREVNGLRDAPSPMVSAEDVALFKLAGGFNSDWDATQLFVALWMARLREWKSQPEADVSIAEWARRASEAAREGRGGVAWLAATVPASASPDAETARWAHDEFYWGAALVRQHYDHEPLYAPEAEGFVHNELLLLDDDLLPALAGRGITRYGLIPGATGALYLGDTADDLDLVLRYRRELSPDAPTVPVAAVLIATGAEAETYASRGADIVLPHVRDLPAAIDSLQGPNAS